ncbi:hypothetical protein [Sphingomonas daechungensis]|uniref:hypothetical protein n=1 Tax=Sphingomonas daechungensis TaxID=1176646 RepID=UPI003784DC92
MPFHWNVPGNESIACCWFKTSVGLPFSRLPEKYPAQAIASGVGRLRLHADVTAGSVFTTVFAAKAGLAAETARTAPAMNFDTERRILNTSLMSDDSSLLRKSTQGPAKRNINDSQQDINIGCVKSGLSSEALREGLRFLGSSRYTASNEVGLGDKGG